jgi:ribonuclease HII
MNTLFIGIDEAGRGPWAGPLVVAGLALFDAKILSEIALLNDSKKLSEKNREKIFNQLQNLKNAEKLDFCVIEKSAEIIDEKGIRETNRRAMSEIIANILEKFLTQNQKTNIDESKICVLIDGSDNFRFEELEEKYVCEYFFARKKSRKNPEANQEPFFPKISSQNTFLRPKIEIQFLIGGDASEKIISAASILAKVTRDSIMKRFSEDFPEYNFAKNR